MIFIDPINKTQVQAKLAYFDVCFIGLTKDPLFRFGVSPNKLFDYLYAEKPILVHTDLKVVDENLNILNESFMSYQGIDAENNKLNNLLMQNTITGCTLMINRKLSQMSLLMPAECIMHDWWIGLVASEFGHIEFLNQYKCCLISTCL